MNTERNARTVVKFFGRSFAQMIEIFTFLCYNLFNGRARYSEFVEVLGMKCPYCDKEMEKGVIQSSNPLSWNPGGKRKLFSRGDLHEGGIVLSDLSILKGSAIVAYLCRDCEKIVLDLSADNFDLNNR